VRKISTEERIFVLTHVSYADRHRRIITETKETGPTSTREGCSAKRIGSPMLQAKTLTTGALRDQPENESSRGSNGGL
jgi:hypothetical protein